MPRKDKGGRHEDPESKLRQACFQLTQDDDEFREICFYGTFNGARLQGGGFAGNKMKAEGCVPGFPDCQIFNPGADGSVALAIEFKIVYEYRQPSGQVKRKINKLSPEQEEWFVKLRSFGWRCAVAYTVDEFKQIVREHIGTNSTAGGGEPSSAATPTENRKRRRGAGGITSMVVPIEEEETETKREFVEISDSD